MQTCRSHEKGKVCEAPATFTVFWPGQTTVACDRHAEGMERIASAMGFPLDKRRIGAEETGVQQP